MNIEELSNKVIGLAIRVHRKLGPGLLESVYQAALAYELKKAGIRFEKEKTIPVYYDEIVLEPGFRCDFLIDQQLILETKAAREITAIDQAQIINYLKLADKRIGLLINFNVLQLKDGLKRLVYNYRDSE
ncbi:GxxExxY protein [candidate division KSB1 bacterium]|nr:GxxExxY protein [candidate division KSB1 bacterium]